MCEDSCRAGFAQRPHTEHGETHDVNAIRPFPRTGPASRPGCGRNGFRTAPFGSSVGIGNGSEPHRDGSGGPTEPAPRQVIATFDNYADAERTVDYLVDRHFEVNQLSIVGRDLELVERVTGKMNYGVAALRGATSGGLVGALIGWLFGLFSWIQPLIAGLVLAFYGLLLGAALGALIGLLMYAMQHGRRDFATVTTLQPRHFDIVADVGVAARALISPPRHEPTTRSSRRRVTRTYRRTISARSLLARRVGHPHPRRCRGDG